VHRWDSVAFDRALDASLDDTQTALYHHVHSRISQGCAALVAALCLLLLLGITAIFTNDWGPFGGALTMAVLWMLWNWAATWRQLRSSTYQGVSELRDRARINWPDVIVVLHRVPAEAEDDEYPTAILRWSR